ncbi:helix-turn-helix domain-containing protein [Congregibacter brevis]|uniref:Helix-turn-helix domain-containing protein n=1 Tax=Congregibacter brevis TaxID=3081201 RepID=A0ABZ0IBV1_9GAMM|nr:helix-turn-helix domain-containing protein [Congregibacter sp. IMCC45268]
MAKKHRQTCPIASFLNVFGDAWTLLVVREAFYGATRFGEFRNNTGAAKNILSDRLAMLVDEGILTTVDVGEQGTRYEYRLTERGESLMPVFVAMTQWGNEQIYGARSEPVDFYEKASGKKLLKLQPRDRQGNALANGDIAVKAGPGASAATIKRISLIPDNECL